MLNIRIEIWQQSLKLKIRNGVQYRVPIGHMGNMHGQLQKNVGCALGPEMTHSPHFGNKYFPYIFKTSTFTQFLMLSSGTISEKSDGHI